MSETKYTVRTEEPDDAAGIRELLLAAFAGAEEADLVDALRDNKSVWEPGLAKVAVDAQEKIIGYVLLTRCWIESYPVLALAPCAVLPQMQGQGIGTALIESAIQEARQESATANTAQAIIVLGHPEYYPRFGFEPAHAHGILAPFDVPQEAFMVLSLHPEYKLPTGRVGYPAEFGIEEDADL